MCTSTNTNTIFSPLYTYTIKTNREKITGNKVVHTTPPQLSVAKMWWCWGGEKLGGFVGGGKGTTAVSKSRTRRRAASRHVNNKTSRFELNKAVSTRNRRTDRVCVCVSVAVRYGGERRTEGRQKKSSPSAQSKHTSQRAGKSRCW